MNPQNPNNPTHVNGTCPTCGQDVSLPFPPVIPFHHTVADSITIPHTQGITCSCGIYWNIGVANFQVALGIFEHQKPLLNEDRKIIESKILPFAKPN